MNLIYGALSNEKIALKYSVLDPVQTLKLDELSRNSLIILVVGNILAIYICILETLIHL